MITKFTMAALLATIAIIGTANAQRTKKFPETKAEIIINAHIDTAFNYIVPVDLSLIFKRYKRLPAVVKTDENEIWFKPGLTRTVYFDDGTTAKETLLTVEQCQSFTYKIEDFTSQLRFLAKRVEGNWQFTAMENGHTYIEWTYTIIPKNFITRFIIRHFILKDINGLLNNGLLIIKENLENEE
ncbi:SRPBCC family protein [Aquiflexum lacus]|uniref:SRPBCC family protein n=1 Tax=Aquiflexum lacus TaxID=2483805 RepID=UPI001E653F89|nr:SRPBCC family protein [Aquiflexum lacus]